MSDAPGSVAAGSDGALSVGSYPGGKSGAGIWQRLINLIPRHRILVSAFAGKCGVTRRIRPAEQTIVIDADESVCEWWDKWRRSKEGRALEIHHCDSVEWLRHRFGCTEFSDARSSAARVSGTAATRDRKSTAECFVFCDPPYVLSLRSHGKQYEHEMSDQDHERLIRILTQIPASLANVMLCGYRSEIYAACDRDWATVDHRVPTRGGLQDERIWMNYRKPEDLHDFRFIGDDRRSRERIHRRQRNWRKQLEAMTEVERRAMLESLKT